MNERGPNLVSVFVEEMNGFGNAIKELNDRYDCDVVKGSVHDLVDGKTFNTEIIGLIKGPRTQLTYGILEKLGSVMKDPIIAYIGRHPEKILDKDVMYTEDVFKGRAIITIHVGEKTIALLPMEQSPLSEAVAAYVVGMTSAVLRNNRAEIDHLTIAAGNSFDVRTGHTFELTEERNNQFEGCFVGIIGAGDIGSRVIDSFSKRGAHVSCTTVEIIGTANPNVGYMRTTAEILQKPPLADGPYIVSIHLPKGVTIPLGSAEGIDLFINASSGSNIDETELMQALDEGRIHRAVVDTFKKEGKTFSEDRLNQYIHDGRLILTPHIAYNNPAMIQKALQQAMDTLLQYRDNLHQS